jgi:choline-glycine betaine transporter
VSENGDKPPWLAATLSLYPGLGHAYLGLWWRAVVWSLLAGLTAATFLPGDLLSTLETEGVASLAGAVPTTAVLMLSSVTAMAAFDAYWQARRGTTGANTAAGASCPECGKDVDEELAFCQWCTAELE